MVIKTLEVPVQGMDCAECTMHVQKAIAALPGVETVEVYLSSEKADRPAWILRKSIWQASDRRSASRLFCARGLPEQMKTRRWQRILPVRS